MKTVVVTKTSVYSWGASLKNKTNKNHYFSHGVLGIKLGYKVSGEWIILKYFIFVMFTLSYIRTRTCRTCWRSWSNWWTTIPPPSSPPSMPRWGNLPHFRRRYLALLFEIFRGLLTLRFSQHQDIIVNRLNITIKIIIGFFLSRTNQSKTGLIF